MSGRSSRPEWALLLLVAAACSGDKKKEPPKLEIDPAKVQPYALAIYENAPSMGSARNCTDADFQGGGIAMTQNSLRTLVGKKPDKEATHLPWVNPTEVEDPIVRMLVAPPPNADPHLVRQAAWAFLQAPFYIVYRVDNVNAPIALNIRELIRGTVEARVLRHERNGTATCSKLIYFQNDKAKSDAAIAASDKTLLDPAIIKAMQDDLHDQYLKHVPVLPLASPPPAP